LKSLHDRNQGAALVRGNSIRDITERNARAGVAAKHENSFPAWRGKSSNTFPKVAPPVARFDIAEPSYLPKRRAAINLIPAEWFNDGPWVVVADVTGHGSAGVY